jgi:hypothetical protein
MLLFRILIDIEIKMKPTQIGYCQFLLSSHTNFTITYYAEHTKNFSHDAINRYLRRDKLSSKIVWEHVKSDIVFSARGCIVFDDTVLDKNHSHRSKWFVVNTAETHTD